MNRFKSFTGGVFDTNCFLYETAAGGILFDAPQGADEAFADEKIALLLLTHGHFDHIADAAAIIRRHKCAAGFHADTAIMARDKDFFTRLGFGLEFEPFGADFLLDEGSAIPAPGEAFQTLFVPGHCPGSLCFFLPEAKVVIGGDVLFRGGVGRWDLPGGDGELLLDGIRRKLLPLGDGVTVLPGHGPPTTIGREREENPYLQN